MSTIEIQMPYTYKYTKKMVPFKGQASSFLDFFLYVHTLGLKNKIERRKRRRRNNNRPINLFDLSIYHKVIG